MQVNRVGTLTVLFVEPDGAPIAAERDALDLIAAAYGQEIDVIAIPAVRLAPEFFRLRTGLAGAILQKLRNYGFRVAIVGDIAAQTGASAALADFVRESNRGRQVVFVPDVTALEAALA